MSRSIAKALVTGGAGFIGSHLIKKLLAKGIEVRVLDNFSSGFLSNLSGLNVEIKEGDICSPEDCLAACKGIDTVFHLAALVSVPRSVQDPVGSEAINTGGTLNMLSAAQKQGVQRLVFSSSAAIYGNAGTVPTPENTLPRPLSPYGAQKLMGEHYARLFASLYGLETVALRYFNVYGPGQDPAGPYAAAIPIFLKRILAGERPTIYGNGEQTRDFCYAEDVAEANFLAASTTSEEAIGSVFNVAAGRQISLNSLLEQIGAALGKSVSAVYAPERPGDIRHSGADISLAQNILGFQPRTSLEEGLQRTAGVGLSRA